MNTKEMGFFGSNSKTETKSLNKTAARSVTTYDASFKKFFSRKEVLAGVLKGVIPEFKDLSHAEVVDRIDSSKIDALDAVTLNTEDVKEHQKIIYDILVMVQIGSKEEVHLIFDLEMQYNFNTRYPLLNRIHYYNSRLLARQPITNANYGELCPVRSTWISVNGVPDSLKNQKVSFRWTPFDNYDNIIHHYFEGSDLITSDLILLDEKYDWDETDGEVVKFLQSIFQDRLDDKRFNPYLEITDEIEQEVMEMNDKLVHLNADFEAFEMKGREEGREEGEIKMITKFINSRISKGFTQDEILEDVQDIFEISKEYAMELLAKAKEQ